MLIQDNTFSAKKFSPLVYDEKVVNHYKNLKPGSIAFDDFWDEVDYYCLNGYKPKGNRYHQITGEHFSYLNLAKIEMLPQGEKRKRAGSPYYRELDDRLFTEIYNAKKYQYGLIIGKARRIGLSWFGSWQMVYELIFVKGNRVGICAGKQDKADSFYAKVLYLLQNIIPEYKVAQYSKNEKKLVLGYDDIINKQVVPSGLMSEMLIRTMFADSAGFEGESLSVAVFEEAGLFQNLIQSYKSTEPCFKEGAIQFGTPIIYGCVCAGTKVWDNSGNLINIEDLKQEQGIIGFKNGESNKEPIVWMKPPAQKECVRITTNMGTILECSIDHPILFSKRHFQESKRIKGTDKRIKKKKVVFKEAELLVPGDQLAMIDNIGVFSDKKMWEPRLVGLLIGDGSYGFDKTPVISSCDKEVHDYISKFDFVVEKENLTKDNKTYRETRIKGITKELRELGIYGQTKLKKRLPVNVHSYCEEDICELLGGFFDADGYVGKKQINLTASSFDLLYEVKLLLQKLGIHSGIKKIKASPKSPKSKNDYYRLAICSKKSLRVFIDKIKFIIEYKEKNKLEILDYANSENEKVANSEYVKGINFEKVISVERIGLRDIYNLNAGDSHTYVANGVITHNTGGEIEKGSYGYMEMWNNSHDDPSKSAYNLRKVFIPADEYYPGDGEIDEKTGVRAPSFFDIETGKTDRARARAHILAGRQVAKQSKDSFVKHIQSYPLEEREIFIKTSGGVLDRIKLSAQNELIDEGIFPEDVEIQVGRLEWVDDPITAMLVSKTKDTKEACKVRIERESKVKFVEDPNGSFRKLANPINNDNMQHKPDIAGTDSYDDETDNPKASVGATVMYRTYAGQGREYDYPIALLAERGDASADDVFYENSVKMCVYYNAENLIEYSKLAIVNYFKDVGAYKYLKERPDLTHELGPSTSRNSHGQRMTKDVKNLVTKLLKREVRDNCHKIWFKDIIDDFMDYGDKNTDIAMAYGLVLIHKMDIFEEILDEDFDDLLGVSGNDLFDSMTYYDVDMDGNLKIKTYGGDDVDTAELFIPEQHMNEMELLEWKMKKKERQKEHEKRKEDFQKSKENSFMDLIQSEIERKINSY